MNPHNSLLDPLADARMEPRRRRPATARAARLPLLLATALAGLACALPLHGATPAAPAAPAAAQPPAPPAARTPARTDGAVGQQRSVEQRAAADPNGTVEIVNVAGRVEVSTWDRAEVEVTGTIGPRVERVELTRDGPRTTVRVVLPERSNMRGGEGAAILAVRVPARSGVVTSFVSSDLVVRGVQGATQLQTVSGDVDAEVGREVRVRTVSGDVRLAARQPGSLLEVSTVSGDVRVEGAQAGGEVNVGTVSGDAVLALGTVNRARLKTVSGDVVLGAALAAGGRLEAESISGDVRIDFAGGVPAAEYEVATLSGDIRNCFGPQPVRPRYGPGSRLSFREGAGEARVSVDTKSGDVAICTKK